MTAGAGIGPREIIRRDWEIFVAVGLMVLVLALLDVFSLRTPPFILSLVPLAFVVVAAVFPVGWKAISAWTSACVLCAFLADDPYFVSLAYSAIAIGVLRAVHRATGRARR